MEKTWFVTGASRGFGRIWAEAALMRGDRVAATARDLASVAHLTERFGDAVFVQSESAEYTHDLHAAPSRPVKFGNKLCFLSLDLLYANEPDADVGMYLTDRRAARTSLI